MTELRITENTTTLLLGVTYRRSLVGTISSMGLGFLFIILLIRNVTNLSLFAALVIGFVIPSWAWRIVTLRKQFLPEIGHLQVTRDEFMSRIKGKVVRVPVCDVRWLEYVPVADRPGADRNDTGVFAILENGRVRLLPYLNEVQSAESIDKILDKFPNIREQIRRHSPFEQHFTLLKLDEPIRKRHSLRCMKGPSR